MKICTNVYTCEGHSEQPADRGVDPTPAPAGPSFESFWDAVLRNNAPQRRH